MPREGRSDGSSDYRLYLNSDWWKARAARAKRAHPYCAACYAKRRLEPHHISYQRLGSERDSDLLILCHCCHRLLHRLLDRTYPGRSTRYKASRSAQLLPVVKSIRRKNK